MSDALQGGNPWIMTGFLGPFFSLGLYKMVVQVPSRSLERPKICFLEVQSSEVALHSPLCPKDLELHLFLITAAKAAPWPSHCPPEPPCWWEQILATCWLSISWRMKLSSICSRNRLDCLFPTVFSLQETSGWLKVPMRTRASEHESAPTCLQRDSSTWSSWCNSLADPHYNAILVPALSLILTHKLSGNRT